MKRFSTGFDNGDPVMVKNGLAQLDFEANARQPFLPANSEPKEAGIVRDKFDDVYFTEKSLVVPDGISAGKEEEGKRNYDLVEETRSHLSLLGSDLSEDAHQQKPNPDIKVIAFDYGGVTFVDGKRKATERLHRELGYDSDVVFQQMTSPESWDLRRGRIGYSEFLESAQNALPPGYNAKTICDYWCQAYELDEDIYNLIQRVRRSYKVVSYTDGIPSRVRYLEEKYRFRWVFDAEVHSYNHDAVKTDRAFAEALLRTSGVENPAELLLIDDQENEVEHVKALGIRVLLYQTGQIDALKGSVRELGIKMD